MIESRDPTAIGARLKQERERLGLDAADVCHKAGGGPHLNQARYESGVKAIAAEYLAHLDALTDIDVMYVLTGTRSPQATASITAEEAEVLAHYRALPEQDRVSVTRLTTALAAMAGR